MESAKGTDLPELLERLGYSVRRVGRRYHTTSSSQSPLNSVSACGKNCVRSLAPPLPTKSPILRGPHWDSLRIKDRRTWKRYSSGQGGDAISFLQEFCGMDFRAAVNYLLEFNSGRARDSPAPRPKSVPEEEKPPFALPMANQDQRRVFAYLKKRASQPR